ncbi:MAG: chemotaxis protein CheC [Betaproteobacteria bacterium]|nr:chemotaxis protein CheC [Betaproteobacteria bacterium]
MTSVQIGAAHLDVLTELGNIGISRAARQLSQLLNEPILIAVPRVELCTPSEAARHLDPGGGGELACVYQRMSGELPGHIALLLPARDTHLLFRDLLGQGAPLHTLDLRAFEHEAMTEIGNILISSCISAMADMLGLRIDVSVPRFAEAHAQELIQDDAGADGERVALLIHTHLTAARRDLEGTILLMLSTTAAEKVMRAVQALILAAD